MLDFNKNKGLAIALQNTLSSERAKAKWRFNKKKYFKETIIDMKNKLSEDEPKKLVEDIDEAEFNAIIQKADEKTEEEISRNMKSIIISATKGFNISLTMAQVIFYTGICIFLATFIIEMLFLLDVFAIKNLNFMAVSGGIFGTIGMGGIVTNFFWKPQTQINESVGNLAQVQIAFLDYEKQARLITTYIGSDETFPQVVESLSRRLSEVRKDTMADIEKYVEEDISLDKMKKTIEEMNLDELEIIKKSIDKKLKT